MVRKWSYITPTKRTNLLLFTKKKNNHQILVKFKFKIFKKNIRFKKSEVKYTNFVRNKVILWERRTRFKNYVIIISKWINFLLKYKNKLNSNQHINFFKNSLYLSYNNVLKETKILSNFSFIFFKTGIPNFKKHSLVFFGNESKIFHHQKNILKIFPLFKSSSGIFLTHSQLTLIPQMLTQNYNNVMFITLNLVLKLLSIIKQTYIYLNLRP